MSLTTQSGIREAAENTEVPPLAMHRFSVDDYHRMGDVCILCEDDRVELLEGWIVPKMNRKPPHDAVIAILEEQLRTRIPANWHVRIQSAITTADSEPEPDLAVVRGTARDYLSRHPGPGDIGLVIEVSDTTLDRDHFKRRLYARAAIANYWIINLVEAIVEVYSEPVGTGASAAYAKRVDCPVGDSVPLILAGQQIDQIPVSELLP